MPIVGSRPMSESEGHHPLPSFRSTFQPSDKGWLALECEEGMKTHAYLDSRGIPTIGGGHTMQAPSHMVYPFEMGDVWTIEKCREVFKADGLCFVMNMNGALKRPINQHQGDALFSLDYNIGGAVFKRSHIVTEVINLHGADAVTVHDFLAWAHPSELKGRRLREWAMYSQGLYRKA